jgi:hypothetical protein
LNKPKAPETRSPKTFLGDILGHVQRLAAIARNPCPIMSKHAPPSTLDEAIDLLERHIRNSTDELTIVLKNSEREFVEVISSGPSKWIREEWRLWDPLSPLAEQFQMHGITHCDDMTRIIFILLWRKINGWPDGLQNLVAGTQQYWREIGIPSGMPKITFERRDR